VTLFEQVTAVQRQWEYTFDSIGRPESCPRSAPAHSAQHQRLSHSWGVRGALLSAEASRNSSRQNAAYKIALTARCGGKATIPIHGCPVISWPPTPRYGSEWPATRNRPRFEGHYRAEKRGRKIPYAHLQRFRRRIYLHAPGRFLDFNDALLRMTGYEDRESAGGRYSRRVLCHHSDRERLKKLLQQHGRVAIRIRNAAQGRRNTLHAGILPSRTGCRRQRDGVSGFLLDITSGSRRNTKSAPQPGAPGVEFRSARR